MNKHEYTTAHDFLKWKPGPELKIGDKILYICAYGGDKEELIIGMVDRHGSGYCLEGSDGSNVVQVKYGPKWNQQEKDYTDTVLGVYSLCNGMLLGDGFLCETQETTTD